MYWMTMAKRTPPPSTNIIFSYVPLLYGVPGLAAMDKEAAPALDGMDALLEALPKGDAKACLWFVDDDGSLRAAFVMENAKAVARHFLEWAENKPGDWFKFHYLYRDSAYAIALFPSFQKTSDRWRMAFQLNYGFPPPGGSENIIFRPLHFTSHSKAETFAKVKGMLKESVRVDLIDASEVTPETLMDVIGTVKQHELGTFQVVREDDKTGIAHGWLNDSIEEMLKGGG